MNLYQLAKSILPESVNKLIFRQLNSVLSIVREAQSNAIPYYELSEKHLKNTKIFINREVILDILPKNSIVAEIGVAKGDFSAQILHRTQPQKLHLVDVWSSDRYHSGLEQIIQEKFVEEFANQTLEINKGLSTDVLPTFKDNYFDWVYIDTDHSYLTTIAELTVCAEKVKKGGLIAGHDYIQGNWDGGVRYGVVEAVHEFCCKENWEILYLSHETHGHASFVIREII